MKSQTTIPRKRSGFALVVTLSLLVLLALLAVGMLSLSSISLRSSSQADNMSQARANARLALMIAIGELQKEMGPDMRVSAESALLDTDEKTEAIEGVARSRWLSSYDSWGNWLNTSYTNPRTSANLTIQNTYSKGRSPMFRRWLLSLPPGQETDIAAPVLATGMDDSNSVVLVGEGSLGASAGTNPDRVTRAYLGKVGDRGRQAWWIGPENHKARIDMANKPRTLAASEWETSQGDTAEVGVGSLNGFKFLDSGADVSGRLVSKLTLQVAGATGSDVQNSFFDLTANGKGVVTSVRSGHLKKDLSLLFEQPSASLTAPYKFNPGTPTVLGDPREPSIRPMSPDLVAKAAKMPNRHFQSWTNMRHYYRMYRQTSDATVKPYAASNVTTSGGGIGVGPGGSGNGAASLLTWPSGQAPYADMVSTANFCAYDRYSRWTGSNNYWRVPILAKITFIFSLQTSISGTYTPPRYNHNILYTPVFTYWNPYNVRLRIPDDTLVVPTSAYAIFPFGRDTFTSNTYVNEGGINPPSSTYAQSTLRSDNGGDIFFEPGQLRVFSYSSILPNLADPLYLYPGFDPLAINGIYSNMINNQPATYSGGIALRFWNSEWGGNINAGNTAGSFNLIQKWTRASIADGQGGNLPVSYQIDWFNVSQQREYITPNPRAVPANPGAIAKWNYADRFPLPFAYVQIALKGQSRADYESIGWEKDWRGKNWIYGAPFYFGHGMYASENADTLHTQRMENPYVMNFGPTSMSELPKIVFHQGNKAFLGSGPSPFEKVTNVPAIELPTAPISSLAGFSGMRINPGWTDAKRNFPSWYITSCSDVPNKSLYGAEIKAVAYQSGVTGPGIGNSFMHPVLPRNDVYRFFDNSISMDPATRANWAAPTAVPNQAYCDYWDHVFLLNDALWDDYFVSSLADQTRPGASTAKSLNENITRLVSDERLPNSRYLQLATGQTAAQTTTELQAADGYLKAARHLMVDGMFNVNSTSVPAWQALFAGIRERQAVYRDASGALTPIVVPTGKRIAITRFNTEVSDKEMGNPGTGETMPDGSPGWSGVRFLDDGELRKLAEECVKQVKRRGPFLNFSEFINRRLSDDDLGTMGALQSAIDYDDKSPDLGSTDPADPRPPSINYRYKSGSDFMLKQDDLGTNSFGSPEAAVGSRFAGIPGYVIQSDILKPIANTLAVRDDTFRVRAYGEALDANGKVTARAWCEAIVQRVPEYYDPTNAAEIPAREIDSSGAFVDSGKLSASNLRFGRRFNIESFRWLSKDEI